MDGWLKQSVSIEIKVGPFVSSTDGVTPQTSLTITSSEVLLSKNEGDWAAKNESTSLVHESNGFYRCLFNTTDTNTLAILRYQIAESGCLPVWGSFLVVPANVYDSLVLGTDLLQSDLTQWLGVAPNALVSSRVDASAGALANAVITDASIHPDAVSKMRSVVTGTADSGSTTTMVDAARTESAPDYWKGCFILFGGSLAGQCRLITGFNPTTDTITFAPATTAAVSVQNYEILPAARVDLHLWLGSVVNALVSGRVDASAQEIGNNAITAAATNADFLAEVNTEFDTALADARLDELLAADSDIDGAAPPTVGSVFHELMSKTAGSFTFDQTTDSLEAVRDKETDIETDTQDIQLRLPAALVDGRIKSIVEAFAAGVIDAASMAANMNSYTTRTWLAKESTTADKYIVHWAKNGQIITSGITLPKIRVYDEDGVDLIAETAMTEMGLTQSFKFIESTNKLTPGEIYTAELKATIDGSVRVDRQPVMRDSA